MSVEVRPHWSGAPLVFDALTNATQTGQRVSVTRLDCLLSGMALRRLDGTWVETSNSIAYLNGREGRTQMDVGAIPSGRYDRLRFNVGVPQALNHAHPAMFAADHPLNPNRNGLHWNWQGGYVFLALEGRFDGPHPRNADKAASTLAAAGTTTARGYSWHLATDRLLSRVELDCALEATGAQHLQLSLDVARIFSSAHVVRLADDTASTHSRADDPLAVQLRDNLQRAFAVESVSAKARPRETQRETTGIDGRSSFTLVASNATAYRLTFSGFYPQPSLPLDNPLTEEGVHLGRRLFHEPRLSVNNQQSCASCHQAGMGFTDGKQFSLGALGQSGTRNAMTLFNLAWRSSFFWDGRAPTLREQVLMPIENPVEMHESLLNVVAKLAGSSQSPRGATNSTTLHARPAAAPAEPDYAGAFTRAFGSPNITADRIARALEQFLLVQVTGHSKFDRSLAGEAELDAEEQRGFELFHTEYDPRRGQSGADCFHCHGGPLFQSQAFANNGLDHTFRDPGRAAVTGREGDRGKFAVPSLRNVARTAPYMHDGRFATLEDAVAHYAIGVKRSPTLDPNLAKHPEGGVPLSPADQRALVAFLRTLTDPAP